LPISDLSHELLFVCFLCTIDASYLSKFSFACHTQVNDCGQIFFVTLFNLVDFFPGVIFDVFPLALVLLEQLFNFLLKFLDLCIFLLLS